jgi:L-threonylcarbamoyladenylate synthase
VPVHLTINPRTPDIAALAPALHALKTGGVIAYPTDTLYGLGADPRNREAVERIVSIKGRREEQSIPLIAADIEQARAVAVFNAIAENLARRFWPGPLTLVVRRTITLADGVGQRDTIALRVPDHAVARALAAVSGFPITSTSANLTGAMPATSAREVFDTIGTHLAVIVDGGPTRGGPPSTIVDVSSGAPRLVRAGAVPWDRVLESLQ